MGPFAIEAAFPLFALIPPGDRFCKRNDEALMNVIFGVDGDRDAPIKLLTGSRAEGLAIDHGFGHGNVDMDLMEVFTGGWTVVICNEKYNPWGDVCHLELDETQSPPAYARVRVVAGTDFGGVKGLLKRMESGASEMIGKGNFDRCMLKKNGQEWLSSHETLCALQYSGDHWSNNVKICPPIGKTGDDFEHIPALLCTGTHSASHAFLERKRPVGHP